MNKSFRIKTNINENVENHIKLKLDQEYDNFEILSLNIDQNDLYQNSNCDFGTIVGRVNANGGIGIPNAKISIFIPLSENDELRPEIKALYPYKKPSDKNSDGKRYNLLPRVAEIKNGRISPRQPIGSFPTKPEITTNDTWLEVYTTYYKYNTITNDSGDYMLYGVPVGTQTIHMSVDITDIGKFSMSPVTLIQNLGYSPNLFTEDNRIKVSGDLNDLPNVETQEIGINVIPFCGDSENFDIGITRQDFRIRAELAPSVIIFGSAFTDGAGAMWGNSDGFYLRNASKDSGRVREMKNKRIAPVEHRLFSWDVELTDDEIINKKNSTSLFNAADDMFYVREDEYRSYKRNGDFVFVIPCNRRRIITGENGNEIVLPNDSNIGAFSEFDGFMTFEITGANEADGGLPLNFSINNVDIGRGNNDGTIFPVRARFKVPQQAPLGQSFYRVDLERFPSLRDYTNNWRKQSYKFEAGKYYSVARFHGTVELQTSNQTDETTPVASPAYFTRGGLGANNTIIENGLIGGQNNFDIINNIRLGTGAVEPKFRSVGLIKTGDPLGIADRNDDKEFPTNSVDTSLDPTSDKYFFGNWLNFSLHLPQIGRFADSSISIWAVASGNNLLLKLGFPFSIIMGSSYLTNDRTDYFYSTLFNNTDNGQLIAGDQKGTAFFARPDLHYTDFIEVPQIDILTLYQFSKKGGTKSQVSNDLSTPLIGTDYRNGLSPVPPDGGKINGDPNLGQDPETYFYKGLNESDCIEFLVSLGLV